MQRDHLVGLSQLPWAIARCATPKVLQRFIAWLAVLIASFVLFIIGGVGLAIPVDGDAYSRVGMVWPGICVALTAVPLMIGKASWGREDRWPGHGPAGRIACGRRCYTRVNAIEADG